MDADSRRALSPLARLKKLAAVLAIGAGLAASAPPAAHPTSYSEYEVKAAFLLHFARLVQWPASAFHDASDPIVLGLLGPDPFNGALASLVAGKQVGKRTITIRRLADLGEIRSCHIVFVSARARAPVARILEAARGASVLLVGDAHDFARRGGTINFFEEHGRIRFAINRRAADAAGLRISSRMLSLAKLVTEDSSTLAPASWESRSDATAQHDSRLLVPGRGPLATSS